MENIELSVIIPCYNNGTYLSEMLDCCLRQTFRSWEVIVVDDGSTDNTPEIVSNYSEKDARIRLVRRERLPKGSVICRNIGFDHSRGKYVIHFDADDLISDTCFENRVRFMEDQPEIDYASFPADSFITDEAPVAVKKRFHPRHYGYPIEGDILTRFLKVDYPFSVWNNIYRKKCIEEIKWDEDVCLYTDFSYITACIFRGLKHAFSHLPEADYYYRVAYSKTTMSASYASEHKNKSTLHLFSWIMEELKKRNDFNQRKAEFKHFVVLHFSRLLASHRKEWVLSYLEFVGQNYGDDVKGQLVVIMEKYFTIQKPNVQRLYMDYKLYTTFWFKRYGISSLHDLYKLLKG